ncbi:palmitoleoyl-protein carboxylesterase NOTUM [Sitophilus oryzae]|uniref:Palmitoleoyl-protein carboxylesterase NOTUM n=1 Tax=Sitophilus oryzae TaxID=7048 RepID=A0A6J2X9S1_SITOR|nr:palmitoleoyl-protein carboxylesterase NOTUM [Sitophilus oryzae]
MRIEIQIISLWLSICATMQYVDSSSPTTLNQPIYTNSIQRVVTNRTSLNTDIKPLKKVFLSNRAVTCNDGSQAGFYLRKSFNSRKWIIFLEGGWYCYDTYSCRNRWLKQRHYMTSSKWPETKDVGGILSSNMEENPYWWNANHVFVPYCSSDSWSGTKRSEKQGMFSFMGSSIVLQVVRDLIPLGLENSTDLLLAGSSAGGTGVMINLDFVEELLHEQMFLKQIKVRGVTDSGWFLDRTPYAPTIKPAVDAIRKGMELWEGKVPRRCREQYLSEPWRCYFGYRLYPTLKTPLFVFQWLFDEAQMDADNVGAPVTKQQWDYIHKMGDALRHSFQNVSAVFAPSCISHSVLTKRDWQEVKIDDISIADALHCWVQKTNRRRIKRRKNHKKKKQLKKQKQLQRSEQQLENNLKRDNKVDRETRNKKKKRRRERKQKERKRKRQEEQNRLKDVGKNRTKNSIPQKNVYSFENRTRKSSSSVAQKRQRNKHCAHRRLERCSWPQCNHSCPKLHNPFTGEEMDFIELLKSFGLDMENVANALGIDMETLNNMDHGELLNLLTQQTN